MSIITNAELALLRTQPHQSDLWLSIYQPPTVLACQVNDASIAKGERSVVIDGITSGAVALVQADMSMWVGTAAGKNDKGTVRVKSAAGSTIEVAENDHINWADDDFLTVVSFYEINAVYPRIVQEDPDALEVTFYKDYDVAYTDQNTVLGSFVCAGGHYAGWVEDDVYYSASGTTNLKGDGLTYEWFFEGGDVTGSSAKTPGYVGYSTPGYYTTRLQVTNDSGGVDTVQRHISIHDRPENGTVNNPILKWSLQDLNGSRDNGGYTGRITISEEDVDVDIIKDGSLIVIFSDDTYGSTEQSIGGNSPNRQSVVFVGYILDGTIEFNYAASQIEFEVGSPSEIMKLAEGYSGTSESKASPSTWNEVLVQDCRRALYTYMRWQSTITKTTDIQFIGTDYEIQFFDADRENLYSAIDTLMRTALKGRAVCDRQGKMYLEVDGYTAGITITNNFTLDKQDWIDQPEIEQAQTDSRSFIETGGIVYTNSSDTFSALLSSAPGVAPGYRGKLDRFQGLALTSQAQLNTLVGDIYAWENSEFPSSAFLLAGNYRNFDIAPQELVSINMDATDNNRQVSFFGKTFIPWAVSWIYESRIGTFQPRVVFKEKTSGFDGTTIIIPDVPDTGGFGAILPFEFPPLNFPPFSFGGANIELYDEGVLLGEVSDLDFIGSPVTAALDGLQGDVTFECDCTVSSFDGVGYSSTEAVTGGKIYSCGASEVEYDPQNLTVNYQNVFFKIGTKFRASIAGTYSVNFDGWLDIANNELTTNAPDTYIGTIRIKHYDSGDTLLSTVSQETSPAYAYDAGGGDFIIKDQANFGMTEILPMDASDYVKFTFELTCPSGSFFYSAPATVNIYRIS